jgi:hypothetical protein
VAVGLKPPPPSPCTSGWNRPNLLSSERASYNNCFSYSLFLSFPFSLETNTRSSGFDIHQLIFVIHPLLFDLAIRCSSSCSCDYSLSTQVPLSSSLPLSLYLSIFDYSFFNLLSTWLWWFWVVFDHYSSLILIICKFLGVFYNLILGFLSLVV